MNFVYINSWFFFLIFIYFERMSNNFESHHSLGATIRLFSDNMGTLLGRRGCLNHHHVHGHPRLPGASTRTSENSSNRLALINTWAGTSIRQSVKYIYSSMAAMNWLAVLPLGSSTFFFIYFVTVQLNITFWSISCRSSATLLTFLPLPSIIGSINNRILWFIEEWNRLI